MVVGVCVYSALKIFITTFLNAYIASLVDIHATDQNYEILESSKSIQCGLLVIILFAFSGQVLLRVLLL